jgi:FkbM family methyltransferase
MGLGGALLRLTNKVAGHFGFKLIRQQKPDQYRKVFARGSFFDTLGTHVTKTEPMTIFDVGAYNGMSAKRFLEIFPHACIHSFEPSPESYAMLDNMSRLPEYHTHVVPHKLALSNQPDHRVFLRHQAPQTDSLLATHPDALEQWPDGRFSPIQSVETTVDTIDSFCTRESIDYIDILKIDAQGEDLRILNGAESMLKQDKIGIIIVEMYFVPVYNYQGEPDEIIQYINTHGFTNIAYLCHDVDRHGKLLCVDAVFKRNKKR